MNISKEQFTKLAKEHLLALESYKTDKNGNKPIEIFGIEKLYEAINVIPCCKSDSEQLPNKWKERCLLAENYINETPCDPDVYQSQQEAWSEWITFKQAMENEK